MSSEFDLGASGPSAQNQGVAFPEAGRRVYAFGRGRGRGGGAGTHPSPAIRREGIMHSDCPPSRGSVMHGRGGYNSGSGAPAGVGPDAQRPHPHHVGHVRSIHQVPQRPIDPVFSPSDTRGSTYGSSSDAFGHLSYSYHSPSRLSTTHNPYSSEYHASYVHHHHHVVGRRGVWDDSPTPIQGEEDRTRHQPPLRYPSSNLVDDWSALNDNQASYRPAPGSYQPSDYVGRSYTATPGYSPHHLGVAARTHDDDARTVYLDHTGYISNAPGVFGGYRFSSQLGPLPSKPNSECHASLYEGGPSSDTPTPRGGYPVKWAVDPTQIQDAILCGICNNILRGPFTATPCGHVFCGDCAGPTDQLMPDSEQPITNCPQCHISLNGRLQLAFHCSVAINSIRAKCPSCSYKSTLRDVFRHESHCTPIQRRANATSQAVEWLRVVLPDSPPTTTSEMRAAAVRMASSPDVIEYFAMLLARATATLPS